MGNFSYTVTEVEGWAAAARLGYFAMDILNPPEGTIWGKFNDRPIDLPQIDKLVEDFSGRLMNSSEVFAMFVAVKKEWVKNLPQISKEVAGLTMDKLPLIEFTPEALEEIAKTEGLWMLSGNHRRRALTIHVQKLRVQLEELQERKRKLHLKQREAGYDCILDAKEKRVDREIKLVMDAIVMDSRWLVRVFDRGAWPPSKARRRDGRRCLRYAARA